MEMDYNLKLASFFQILPVYFEEITKTDYSLCFSWRSHLTFSFSLLSPIIEHFGINYSKIPMTVLL